jgi:hypothetical protein
MSPRALTSLAKNLPPHERQFGERETGEGRPDHCRAEYPDIAVGFKAFEGSLADREILHREGKRTHFGGVGIGPQGYFSFGLGHGEASGLEFRLHRLDGIGIFPQRLDDQGERIGWIGIFRHVGSFRFPLGRARLWQVACCFRFTYLPNSPPMGLRRPAEIVFFAHVPGLSGYPPGSNGRGSTSPPPSSASPCTSAGSPRIIGHADVIPLVADGRDEIGWTRRQVREEEMAIIGAAERIGESSGRALGRTGHAKLARADLTAEQRAAAQHITDGRQIGIVIGRAGTGKSHTLNTARHAFEAEGYRVIGLAPTNAVVADLRKDGYAHAATLHRELGQLERDPARWDRKTVVMVDEAGMMDNGIMAKLLKGAEQSGAKLILAGDDRQFASVSRGGMFTELVNLHGVAELKTVLRQRQAYQAKASEDFARGDIHAALEAYDRRGQIVWCDSLANARQRAVAAQASITGPSFLYASTNKEVEELNRAEQLRRRADLAVKGESIQAHGFKTVRGDVSISAGERVQFYETNRRLGVATSEFGTVKAVAPRQMEIVKDDGATVTFDPVKYDKWGLGYSGTGYKGQGKTQVRTAAVYDNPYAWDARAAYVIGTRHREDYRLFVPRELAPDLTALTGQIMRQREDKGSSLRFKAVDTKKMRQVLADDAASQKIRAALEKGRETLIAAQAERLRRAEELRKDQELRHTLRPRGPSLGR